MFYRAIKPTGGSFYGMFIFDLWPLFLLAWIVYWAIKKPVYTSQTYFLFVVFICFVFVYGVVAVIIQHYYSPTKKCLSHYAGIIPTIVFLLLAIYQLWARRKFKEENLTGSAPESKDKAN